MTETTFRPRAVLTAVALLAALPLALSACSSADPGADSTSAAQGVGAKWGDCMRSAGFDVPDPADEELASGVVRTPPGADEQAFGEAARTCQQDLGLKSADDAQRQTWERQYSQVASCIREHGYADFPEQEPGVLSTGEYARASEPAFEKTFQDCLAEFAPDTKQQNPG
ncbi:hypothetical protein C1N91_02180 [Curtobacterium sp. SGAir0471]|uniref:hypothetical protein n=1 Tax=Curtobacterium sp. SGAir0471 TaxID=2070337 RepID=UPI0010CCD251|nr:hypothetical protein [Curtobacterium sp. SGAir0471]QCR42528.1 hypothetical protein C1N91_02180 [Curtobacterium sp. SGAir0471]